LWRVGSTGLLDPVVNNIRLIRLAQMRAAPERVEIAARVDNSHSKPIKRSFEAPGVIRSELRDYGPKELVEITGIKMVCDSVSDFVQPHDEIPGWVLLPADDRTAQT